MHTMKIHKMHTMKNFGHFLQNVNFSEKSGTFEQHLNLHAQYVDIFMNGLWGNCVTKGQTNR